MPNKVKHGKRLYKQMAMEVAVRNPERYPEILSVFAKQDKNRQTTHHYTRVWEKKQIKSAS